jgi:hypothetical protein
MVNITFLTQQFPQPCLFPDPLAFEFIYCRIVQNSPKSPCVEVWFPLEDAVGK